ncbi:hypothetical protein EK21DRAFT_78252 [Setomelanomma holmii]|uniref:Zn(2)-C6 fungal-type domain-containing protein n=1 Tax=Setomelanomma holmii TaxID=210430 RepID=A0A9P4GXV6_9PLEO|nr:hypothetical protein EK21DRAFT_78252 [Setomelanomma holmii]
MPPNISTIRRKVKSGCLTCKARKVKCDELKPVCKRCLSTGRTCDGYGIWGGGGNGYEDRYCLLKTQTTSVKAPAAAHISLQESQQMNWFKDRMLRSVSGLFTPTLWTRLVMPAAWTEPAVYHAVLALSSAHQGTTCRRQCLLRKQHDFTLQQYNLAIRQLQPLLTGRTTSSVTVVLITCLIFTSLEYVKSRYQVAATHLESGLKLMKSVNANLATNIFGLDLIKYSAKSTVDLTIFQSFATLHIQAELFGNHISDPALLLQPLDIEMPTPVFANVEEARYSLYKLFHGIILLSRRVRSRGSSIAVDDVQQPALALLLTWRATYEATFIDNYSTSQRDRLAYTLLLNYHAMATTICETVTSNSEIIYGVYTDTFASIVERSLEIWKNSTRDPEICGMGTHCDMGWIPPLYFTALKCRVRPIRVHAIRLLQSAELREGLFDSALTASIAAKVMQLEECNPNGDSSTCNTLTLHEVPRYTDLEHGPLEENLVSEVQAKLLEGNKVSISCKQQVTDRIIRCAFDGVKWHDIKCP